MAKRYNTRAMRAAELHRLVTQGPSFSIAALGLDLGDKKIGKKDTAILSEFFETRTRIWLGSWVAPLIRDLVPELKQK